MNTKKTGTYIAYKRKQKALTQQQLADQIGVSNRTVSKWERGICLPDYSVIGLLCQALDVSIEAVIAGEDPPDGRPLEALYERISQLESERKGYLLVILLLLGIVLVNLSKTLDDVPFLSGVLLGVGVGTLLVSVVLLMVEVTR